MSNPQPLLVVIFVFYLEDVENKRIRVPPSLPVVVIGPFIVVLFIYFTFKLSCLRNLYLFTQLLKGVVLQVVFLHFLFNLFTRYIQLFYDCLRKILIQFMMVYVSVVIVFYAKWNIIEFSTKSVRNFVSIINFLYICYWVRIFNIEQKYLFCLFFKISPCIFFEDFKYLKCEINGFFVITVFCIVLTIIV